MPEIQSNGIVKLEQFLLTRLRQSHPGWKIGILFIICFFSFFVHIGRMEVDLMEARNFVTAREMVQTNQWWIPTMNGEIRIAKPPLPTWLTAAAMLLAGKSDNPTILRLPAALMGTLFVLSMWGFIGTLTEDTLLPFICAAILATSLIVIDMSRRGHWDIYGHSFMLCAIWILFKGLKNQQGDSFGIFIFAGVLLAASFLSKGPVPFYALLLPFSCAYFIAFGMGEFKQHWRGLAICLSVFMIISAIWPLSVLLSLNSIAVNTAKGETAAWVSRHVQPFYFYGHFILYAGIWALVVLVGLIPRFAAKRVNRLGKYTFIVSWLLLSIFLLSIIPEKKERYLLPAAVPMAVLAGYLVYALIIERSNKIGDCDSVWLPRVVFGLAIIAAIVAPIVRLRVDLASGQLNPLAIAVWWGIFWALVGFSLVALRQKTYFSLFLMIVILACLLNMTLIPSLSRSTLFIKNPSYKSLATIRTHAELTGVPLYTTKPINMKYIFKTGKRVDPWGSIVNNLEKQQFPIAILTGPDTKAPIPKHLRPRIRMRTLQCIRYDPMDERQIICVVLLAGLL